MVTLTNPKKIHFESKLTARKTAQGFNVLITTNNGKVKTVKLP